MTNHRAEAEAYLDLVGDTPEQDGKIMFALLGIGHALLALSDQQASPTTTLNLSGSATREQIRAIISPTVTTTGENPATPAEGQRCESRHDGLRCVFWSGHKDPHRATWRDE
jgi:hypothetical protein